MRTINPSLVFRIRRASFRFWLLLLAWFVIPSLLLIMGIKINHSPLIKIRLAPNAAMPQGCIFAQQTLMDILRPTTNAMTSGYARLS